jgi:polyferredoxin
MMGAAIVAGMAVLVSTMFWGRRFCAYLCPLGSVLEAVYGLRSRKYKLRKRLPYFVDRKYAFIKYLILMLTLITSILGVGYVYIRACPFYALSRLPGLAIQGLVWLAIILVSGLFIERFWCRFLCPYAALMNVFQKLGELAGLKRRKVKRNLERCTDCGVCMLYCPMNLNISEAEYVHCPDCIHCGLCSDKCPKPGTYSEECE